MTTTIRCSSSPPPSSRGGDALALYMQLSDGLARTAALITNEPDEAYAMLWAGVPIVRR